MRQLGEIEVRTIEMGRFALDGGAMFGVVPKPLWEKQIAADVRNRIPLALRCLLLRVAGRLVLVDTGAGENWSEREQDIYDLAPVAGGVLGALQRIGVAPDEVTDVILTHLHFDHAGGIVRRDGAGTLVPTFSEATHHLQRRHFKWAEHASEKDRGSFKLDEVTLLARSGRLHLLDGDTEIFDGVEVLVSEGHSVGQQLVRVRGGGETLLYCGDVIPTTAHLRIPWVMGYDLYPLTTIEEKKAILAQAVEDNWILVFEHDPVVAACRVREDRGQVVVAEAVALA
ncbi:MAG: MBL fold metallo-hydrolase [Pseudomonadota bacterium]